MMHHCGCGCFSSEDIKHEVEETKEGLVIKITAKDKAKLKAFKHLIKAHKSLCGC